jgi:hypothetical protein
MRNTRPEWDLRMTVYTILSWIFYLYKSDTCSGVRSQKFNIIITNDRVRLVRFEARCLLHEPSFCRLICPSKKKQTI